MKLSPKFIIAAATLIVLIFAALDYLSAFNSYERLKEEANSNTFESIAIGYKEERFLEHIQSSWVTFEIDDVKAPLMEFCEMTEFDQTVAGLVQALTHEVPPFSAWNIKQNFREVTRAGGLIGLDLESISTDGKIYHKEGGAFLKVRNGMVEYYEDSEQGVRYFVYGNPNRSTNE